MLKQFYSSILSMTAFLFSVIVLCTLSFNWSNFKKIYDIDEINIYGTNFFDQSIIEEKSDVLKSYNIFQMRKWGRSDLCRTGSNAMI